MHRHSRIVTATLLFVLALLLSSCATGTGWTRRDMPTNGLTRLVEYSLKGPANTDREENQALLRGVNEFAPTLEQEVKFNRMSGSKTQDVRITLPDGRVGQGFGMVKTKRFAGLSHYMTLESATFSGIDHGGRATCGAKIRLQFNRNFFQYVDPDRRDWDAIFYYDMPCQKNGTVFRLAFENARLRALVINEVWQFRIVSGSWFFNWGHSVTAIGGPAAALTPGWWTHWDVPESSQDAMGAYQIVNAMVADLESSPQPWLEFSPGGAFYDSAYLIYSSADADKYATFDRIFLNRQTEYAVFYRPDRKTPWDYVTVIPVYNYEWNDVHQQLAALKGLDPRDPFRGRLDESGAPNKPDDEVVKEFERIGWMNSPNASLEQIQIKDRSGAIIYTMTVRAFIGAMDTLVMFGRARPVLNSVQPTSIDQQPMPVLYDEAGRPLSRDKQLYQTQEQWAAWLRESTMWNFLKDNPRSVRAELMVQYRFQDASTWIPVYTTDSDGNKRLSHYEPKEWNLNASYYFDSGKVRDAWFAMQILGEVGVRTLGMSYASGRYEGTGMLFAMSQIVHQEEYFTGYLMESPYRFDARASQLPDTLKEAWEVLHRK